MKLLIDTNVILDYLLARPGFYDDAFRVFSLAAFDETYEFVSSSAVTDIFYHVKKELHDSYAAQNKVRELLRIITVLDVTQTDILKALELHWKDFEDAVQFAVALANHVDVIITRNQNGFENTMIPALSPSDFLASLE
ncbi:MAG: PIN domain-containing protein [Oscillospiraceae bacterium]|nr:PIN domain-containing protein [Oscillospiraceae bacterium]